MNNFETFEYYDDDDSFLTDTLDHDILMHRDAHFGGSFDVMLDYYKEDRVGVNPDFDIERIEYLDTVEKELQKNLSPLVLDENEMDQVIEARKAYKDFKAIYDMEDKKSELPTLIADLILSEEEEPEEEIEALVKKGDLVVPELLALIKSDTAYNPLFPGYGYAPYLAMKVLAKIKDERAIVPLFESLNKEGVFGSEAALDALVAIGSKAESFLLKVLKSRPVTNDNTLAAFALSAFPTTAALAQEALNQVNDPDTWRDQMLFSYLLCHIESLGKSEIENLYASLTKNPKFPLVLKRELEAIAK